MSEENANVGIDGNFFVSGNDVDKISTLDMLQKRGFHLISWCLLSMHSNKTQDYVLFE